MNNVTQYIPLFLPIILIQVVLIFVSLLDLAKRETVRFNSKVLWILIIVFINILGPIIYLLFGRGGDNKDASA